MLETINLTKRFDGKAALSGVSFKIEDGAICGIVGSNGAGKSTLLRLISGIYRADEGKVLCDGQPVYENPVVKAGISLVTDEQYFPTGTSFNGMANMYAAVYKSFDKELFARLIKDYGLDPSSKVSAVSKGMRRQGALALALAARPRYLLLDETFDGLDPVMRGLSKRFIYDEVAKNGTTVILSSHSLRELEDTCDRLAMLHRGNLVFDSDLSTALGTTSKVQIAFAGAFDEQSFEGIELYGYKQNGRVASFITKMSEDEVRARLCALEPVLLEILPLTTEELFMDKLASLGYSLE